MFMNTKIICMGIKIGALSIPSFVLKSGMLLQFHWPLPKGSNEDRLLESALTDKECLPNLQKFTLPYRSSIPFWGERIDEIPLKTALITLCKISEIAALQILNKLHLPENILVTSLSFTDKHLLGLEIAWHFSDTIIFDSAGLDMLGVKKVFESIQEKIVQNGSAIHIHYPSLSITNETVQLEIINTTTSNYEILL